MPASATRKQTRISLGITSPIPDSERSPNPKHLNLSTEDTMASGFKRPPILTTINEDVRQNECSLTKLLE